LAMWSWQLGNVDMATEQHALCTCWGLRVYILNWWTFHELFMWWTAHENQSHASTFLPSNGMIEMSVVLWYIRDNSKESAS
jgi:hypothetical protein